MTLILISAALSFLVADAVVFAAQQRKAVKLTCLVLYLDDLIAVIDYVATKRRIASIELGLNWRWRRPYLQARPGIDY
jgi:hypothetical protein